MESTLVELIKHFEKYSSESQTNVEEDNLVSFTLYLHGQLEIKSTESSTLEKDQWNIFSRDTLIEMATAYLGKMGRYLDQYARKNLPLTPIDNLDEFTYLILLLQVESITKTEIIQRNVHPITTGTEIIKRLLKKEFIEQFPDAKDRRKIRITLTDKGRNALFESAETTRKLALISSGILSNEELITFVTTLKKLDVFHKKIHDNHKHLDLTALTADESIIKQFSKQ